MKQQNFLKQIREEKKVKQSDLAKRAGITRQAIWAMENSQQGISHKNLLKLAEALGVNPSLIATGENNDKYLDETGKKKMFDAMALALQFYGDNYEKEDVVRVASELLSIINDFELNTSDISKSEFRKKLNHQVMVGLAAKCFLDSFNN